MYSTFKLPLNHNLVYVYPYVLKFIFLEKPVKIDDTAVRTHFAGGHCRVFCEDDPKA